MVRTVHIFAAEDAETAEGDASGTESEATVAHDADAGGCAPRDHAFHPTHHPFAQMMRTMMIEWLVASYMAAAAL